MGLSERKTKQRIPNDPRNLCWADDAARFGSNYLAKFGWDGSTGLGVTGDGRTSHIRVSHKLDLLGIGAAQQKDPDGIAWKQNKDFERLLQRLNDETAAEKNQALQNGQEEVEPNVTEKKRKHREDDGSKTERKKKRKADMNKGQSLSNTESTTIQPDKIETTVVQVKKTVAIPRHRAHRARAINAKNISSKSAHIAEILAIAPRSDSGEQLSGRPQSKLTSLTDQVEIEKMTTSTKSVTDYFKEKLNARSSSAIISTSTTPRDSDDSYDTPRMGLGSVARLDILSATAQVGPGKQGMGLSTFSSSLVHEKMPKDEDSATTPQMNPGTNLTGKKKKKRQAKNEEMEEEREEEREERKRKMDKEKKHSQDNLKRQEKRKRKAEKLQVSSTSPQAEGKDPVHASACIP